MWRRLPVRLSHRPGSRYPSTARPVGRGSNVSDTVVPTVSRNHSDPSRRMVRRFWLVPALLIFGLLAVHLGSCPPTTSASLATVSQPAKSADTAAELTSTGHDAHCHGHAAELTTTASSKPNNHRAVSPPILPDFGPQSLSSDAAVPDLRPGSSASGAVCSGNHKLIALGVSRS
jgi:hypothetical protein